ncbi:hypothetical protein SLS60_001031 [Paraconiothyrium brasiliense]|uniref:Uncharacterized protein n=1 Tax=Paraconiothyrium brasiliense TaxID=300254 RepID=A0ABR3S844_9PLEO
MAATAIDPELHDIWDGKIPKFGVSDPTSGIVFPNGTITDPTDPEQGDDGGQQPFNPDKFMIVTMGTERKVYQHVGFTRSRDLGTELRSAINQLCSMNPWATISGPQCRRQKFEINGIYYHGGSNGVLEVTVESDYLPELNSWDYRTERQLFDMFVDQIVKAFEASVSTNVNRYQLSIPGRPWDPNECTEFANSAGWYQVGIHGLNYFPHLRVMTKFNGKTLEGRFDCKGSQTNVWDTIAQDRMRDYAAVMNMGLQFGVHCSPDPGWPTGDCEGNAVTCDLDPNCYFR